MRLSPDRSKTGVGRILPLSSPLLKVLRRRAKRRKKSRAVFDRDGLPVRVWRTAFRKACDQAGLLVASSMTAAERRRAIRARRSARARRDDVDRPQDPLRVRSLQHRERTRLVLRGSTAGGLPRQRPSRTVNDASITRVQAFVAELESEGHRDGRNDIAKAPDEWSSKCLASYSAHAAVFPICICRASGRLRKHVPRVGLRASSGTACGAPSSKAPPGN